MKHEVDKYLNDYGQENLPPPFLFYTIPDDPGMGNLHIVQKVFEGPFEV